MGGNIKHRMSCMNYCWSDGSVWTITGVCVCVCVCLLKGQALGWMLRLVMAVAEKHVVGEKYRPLYNIHEYRVVSHGSWECWDALGPRGLGRSWESPTALGPRGLGWSWESPTALG